MGPVTIILIAVGVLGAAGGAYFFLAKKKDAPGESVYYFNCKYCKRRLKFRPRQAGHTGQCPSCKKALTFPPLSQASSD